MEFTPSLLMLSSLPPSIAALFLSFQQQQQREEDVSPPCLIVPSSPFDGEEVGAVSTGSSPFSPVRRFLGEAGASISTNTGGAVNKKGAADQQNTAPQKSSPPARTIFLPPPGDASEASSDFQEQEHDPRLSSSSSWPRWQSSLSGRSSSASGRSSPSFRKSLQQSRGMRLLSDRSCLDYEAYVHAKADRRHDDTGSLTYGQQEPLVQDVPPDNRSKQSPSSITSFSSNVSSWMPALQRSSSSLSRVSPSHSFSPLPNSILTSFSSSCRSIDGHTLVYVHSPPLPLSLALCAVESPLFLLGAPLRSAAKRTSLKVSASFKSLSSREEAGAVRSPAKGGGDGLESGRGDTFNPLLMEVSEAGDQLHCALFKRASKADGRPVVIELLYRMIRVQGEKDEIVVYYETVNEAVLRFEDRARLHERRKLLRRNHMASGSERGCVFMKRDHLNCTRVLMMVSAQYDVDLKQEVCDLLLKRMFHPLEAAQILHEKCDEIDERMYRHFTSVTMKNAPPPTDCELKLVDDSLKYNDDADNGLWLRINGSLKSHPTVHMFSREDPHDRSISWGKCCGEVDETILDVLAWLWLGTSYERMRTHRERNGNLPRKTDAGDNNSHSQVFEAEFKLTAGFKNRFNATKFTWLLLDCGDVAIAFEPAPRTDATIFTSSAVESKARGLYYLSPIAKRVTSFTLVQTVHFGGSVPSWITKAMIKTAFTLVLRVQSKYRRVDRVVDEEIRKTIANRIHICTPGVPLDLHEMFRVCGSLQHDFERDDTKHLIEQLKPPSPFVRYSTRPVQKDDSDGVRRVTAATGKVVCDIDTSAEEAASWLWGYCSRERMTQHWEKGSGLPRFILSSNSSNNSFVAATIKPLRFPLSNREFVTRMAWMKSDSTEEIFICADSVSTRVDYGTSYRSSVRGDTVSFCSIKRINEHSCYATFYQKLSSGGFIPISVANSKISVGLGAVDELRISFRRDELIDSKSREAMIAELAVVGSEESESRLVDEDEQAIFNLVAESVRNDGSALLKKKLKRIPDMFVSIDRFNPSRRRSTSFIRESGSNKLLFGSTVTAIASPSSIVHTVAPRLQRHTTFVAEVMVDADVLTSVAWQVLKCSRQRSQSFFDNDGGSFRTELIVSKRWREISETFFVQRTSGGTCFKLSKSELLWKKCGGDAGYIVVEQQKGGDELHGHLINRHSRLISLRHDLRGGAVTPGPISALVVGEWNADTATDRASRELIKRRIREDSGREYTAAENGWFERALHMEKIMASGDSKIKALKTRYSLLDTSTAYVRDTHRDRFVLCGSVKCVVRARPIDILAFNMDYDSIMSSKHERGTSTLERKTIEIANNHRTVGYLSVRVPFCADRDYVFNMLWRKESESQFILVNCPTDHEMAPSTPNVVRAEAVRIFRLTEVELGVTRLELTFSIDPKGMVPVIVTKKFAVPAALSGPAKLQKYFQFVKPASEYDKEGEDATMLAQLFLDELYYMEGAPHRVAVLQQFLARASSLQSVATKYQFFSELLWQVVSNQTQLTCIPCLTPLRSFSTTNASSVGRSFASCLKDSPAPQVGVQKWLSTYPAMTVLFEEFNFLLPFLNQVGKTLLSKSKQARTVVVKAGSAFETQFEEYHMQHLAGLPQTKVVTKFTLGATRYSRLVEHGRILAAARHLTEMRICFDKSVEIDRKRRKDFSDLVKANEEVYEDSEIRLFEGLLTTTNDYNKRKNRRRAAAASPLTEATTSISAEDNEVWGGASSTVRAPSAHVLAYFWNTDARNQKKADTVFKICLEQPNNHNRVEYVIKENEPFTNRELCQRMRWMNKPDENALFFASLPEESSYTASDKQSATVRASLVFLVKVIREGDRDDSSRIEVVLNLKFGGDVALPLFVKSYVCEQNLHRVTTSQQYFQELRIHQEYDERDGAAVGEAFMLERSRGMNGKRRKNQIRVSTVVDRHVGLRDFATKNPWFRSLVEGMLSNWLVDPKNIKTKLDHLSNKEAWTIGLSFALACFERHSAGSAAEMFITDYSSLVEFRKRERFFAPMTVKIGHRKLEQAVWGLAFKVGSGALLGLLDTATDIIAVVNFQKEGKSGFMLAIILTIATSLVIQMVIVYSNGKSRGVRHLAIEFLIVLSGLKPAFDAHRIISGVRPHVSAFLDPMSEHVLCKSCEIVVESIPSSFVQIYAAISSGTQVSTATVFSIVVSIVTISVGMTSIAFDLDLDPEKRGHTPDFYGYVPNDSTLRVLVFVSMLFFVACHVTVRLLGFVLLSVVSPVSTVAFLGADTLASVLFKLARDDLRYSFDVDGLLGWMLSLMQRVLSKFTVDFCCFIQARHPQELGGVHWILTLVLGQGTSFLAAYLYQHPSFASRHNNAENTEKESTDLWILLGSLEASFVVFFAIFMTSIQRKYVRTFFSSITAKQFRINAFHEATTDQARINILKFHPSYYASIRGEVEQWVRDNYDAWTYESPEWFTHRAKSRIPIEMIPSTFSNYARDTIVEDEVAPLHVQPLVTEEKRKLRGGSAFKKH